MPRGYGGDEYSAKDVEILRKALGAGGQAATKSGQTAALHRGAVKGYIDDGLGDVEQSPLNAPEQGATDA